MSSTLDSFVKSSRPPPESVSTSQEVRDRGSIFIANLYRASSVIEAQRCINHLKYVVHGSKRATHEIAAWRCMVVKPGSTGLNGPDDFELKSGYDEDGEQWAGNRVLKVMQNHSIIDAVVIVSRWYGGALLGPARFTHIGMCAEEVCQEFKKTEELRDCITTLTSLDDLLALLRSKLNKGASSSALSELSKSPGRDYSQLELSKAKRLIAARENSINSCKNLLAKQSPSPT